MEILRRHWHGAARRWRRLQSTLVARARGSWDAAEAVQRPLLDATELRDLLRRLEGMRAGSVAAATSRRRMGEQHSIYLGRGLDFEELRGYVPGDDLRDMDWRATARRGRPYVKVYREERQGAVHLVVDRGPSMRFGTRRQLKVTLAARLAALFAFGGMARGACVGAVLLGPAPEVVPCRAGRAAAMALVEAAAAPCPPCDAHGAPDGPWLPPLALAELRAARGARIVLLSDFRGLTDADRALLGQLAARHELWAIQLLDPVEEALPDVGAVPFRQLDGGPARWLDTGDARLRRAFDTASDALLEAQAAELRAVGARVWRCTTAEDVFERFAGLAIHGG